MAYIYVSQNVLCGEVLPTYRSNIKVSTAWSCEKKIYPYASSDHFVGHLSPAGVFSAKELLLRIS